MKRSIIEPLHRSCITGDYEKIGQTKVDMVMYGVNTVQTFDLFLHSIYLPDDATAEIFRNSSKKDIWSHMLINRACYKLIWDRILRHTFRDVNMTDRIKITQLMRLRDRVLHLSLLNPGVWPYDEHMEIIIPEIDPVYTITDAVLQHMTKLTYLNLAFNMRISDASVSLLTNLKQLVLTNSTLADATIMKLPNLRHLDLWNNEIITDDCVSRLTNLRSINLGYNDQITDVALMQLTNLTKLEMSGNDNITDNSVSKLTNLKSINVASPMSHLFEFEMKITSASLECLPSLEKITFRKLDITQLFSFESMKKYTMRDCKDDSCLVFEI